jgi:putative peptidoglycan lipid II flippase
MDQPPVSVTEEPAPPVSGHRKLARSAGVAGAATLTSRLLGLVRETVLAAIFGAGNQMDAFNVAFRIPNLVRDLFAEGAMSAAFVPTFTSHYAQHGKAAAWRLGNNVLTALVVITGVLVLLGIVFADPLVRVYAGRFSEVPGKLELTVQLARVMLPFLTLAAVAGAVMGMLNSLHHYFVPALSPAMFNVATIACAFLLAPFMPPLGYPPIMAIALGTLIGGLGQVALQWPMLATEGFRYRPVLNFRDPGLRRVLVLMGPGTLGLAATQVNVLVNMQLATAHGTGAVSWLAFAFRVMYLPIGLFGVSIATAVLPTASRHAQANDSPAVRRTLSSGLGLMLALNIPATAGLVVLSTPIVRMLFEHGNFLPSDTAATAAALQLYAVGLLGYSASRIASPVFYALGRNRVPVLVSVGSVALNVVLSVLLVRVMGFRGLALGTSLAALAHGCVSLLLLRRHLGGLDGSRLTMVVVKTIVAAAAMAGVARTVHAWAATMFPSSSVMMQGALLASAIGAGMAVLVAAAKILGIRELDDATTSAIRRVRKLLN